MSNKLNNDGFDMDEEEKSSDDDGGDSPEADIKEAGLAMVDAQPQKPEEDIIKADLVQRLKGIVEASKYFLESHGNPFGVSFGKGILLHGKPGLGPRVLKYLQLHCKDIAFVFPRDLRNLSPAEFNDTFDRANCCEPSVVLLFGVEHADGDMEQMIAKKIKENCVRIAQVVVAGTTAMLSGVSEDLRKSFGVVDLEELKDSLP